jgi:hypothetical protein
VLRNFTIQLSAYHLIEILVFGIFKSQYTFSVALFGVVALFGIFSLKHMVLWHYFYFLSMSITPTVDKPELGPVVLGLSTVESCSYITFPLN